MTDIEGDLEGEKITFAAGDVVDVNIDEIPIGLLVVKGEVLHRRDDVVGLYPFDGVADHCAGQ